MASTTKCERASLLLVFILGFATIAEPLYKWWRNKVPFDGNKNNKLCLDKEWIKKMRPELQEMV